MPGTLKFSTATDSMTLNYQYPRKCAYLYIMGTVIFLQYCSSLPQDQTLFVNVEFKRKKLSATRKKNLLFVKLPRVEKTNLLVSPGLRGFTGHRTFCVKAEMVLRKLGGLVKLLVPYIFLSGCRGLFNYSAILYFIKRINHSIAEFMSYK